MISLPSMGGKVFLIVGSDGEVSSLRNNVLEYRSGAYCYLISPNG